jgi:radical SAM superfamily enzyme YgiQ (UPF0313 family)
MKNIYLFQANDPSGTGQFVTHWLPYTIAKIWSYSNSIPEVTDYWRAAEFYFEKLPIKEYLEMMDKPALCAFSTYAWNRNYHKQISKAIKEKWPECVIVFGGPEVADDPDRLLEFFNDYPHIDYCINGEGEIAFANLLQFLTIGNFYIDLLNPNPLPKGVSNREYATGVKSDRIMDLDTLPSPYLNGVLDSIVAKHPDKKWSAVAETSRGCPFKCTFCDWGGLTFSKTKKMEMDVVFDEVTWLADNKVAYVYISDANFGIFNKRDFDIIKHMVAERERTGFPEALNFNWQKNSTEETFEMFKYLADSGMDRGFTLSVQSMSDEVLENIKRKNMEINNLSHILHLCNVHGISTYSELILGLPGETYETWTKGYNKLLNLGQHHCIETYPALSILNSELNSKESLEKYQIETSEVPNPFNYHANDAVVTEYETYIKSTNTLPHDDLINCLMYSWMITTFHSYGLTEVISRWVNKVNGIPFSVFYRDFLEWIQADPFISELYKTTEAEFRSHYQSDGHGITFSMYRAIIEIHKNYDVVDQSIKDFLKTYHYLVPEEVQRFNYEYTIKNGAPLNKEVEFDIPVWHILNDLEHDDTKCTYKFTTLIDTEGWDFYDTLYFKRRQGAGRYKIIIAEE